MSEAAAGTAGAPNRAYIDDICDFVRNTLNSMADAVTPPAEACQHFRESRIEFLRGIRTIIDHRIDHLSRKNQTGARVNVD
jgi:iron-sulfur cluster repair protein YtfE (RIC family)